MAEEIPHDAGGRRDDPEIASADLAVPGRSAPRSRRTPSRVPRPAGRVTSSTWPQHPRSSPSLARPERRPPPGRASPARPAPTGPAGAAEEPATRRSRGPRRGGLVPAGRMGADPDRPGRLVVRLAILLYFFMGYLRWVCLPAPAAGRGGAAVLSYPILITLDAPSG